ncbi:thiamine phosphate synthase [Candidatus Vallotia tarda]|uniref:Thiamin-phosphate pyrophosphorylase n=1 Tax=Candidatus Vallotiella hemipterorum TaxID=1177213 RepID=A0A916JUV5_9BURK|nr:thiamine phosphate synthase [Candidatus Vallotia tarda]CAG7603353.1 Thiamin-phosphate pyrophosphorylase [Candidatus Vallotia tarda]
MSDFFLGGREVFYPTSDKLLKTAKKIRAGLGDWPCARQPVHICFVPPPWPLGYHDVIIATDTQPSSVDAAFWIDSGAAVLDASARTVTRLYQGHTLRILEASRCADWIAALAAFIDCGYDLHDALCLALAWRHGDEYTQDPWPSDISRFPRVLGLPDAPVQPFAKCPAALGLYPIVPTADWISRLLLMGVCTVQLRRKVNGGPHNLAVLQNDVRAAIIAGRRYKDARVFINDHWKLALEERAYGVHLGQEDLWRSDISALMEAGLRLGVSSHGYYEILVALHFKPSYIALGAVFPTTTKVMPSLPQGLSRLTRYVHLLKGVTPCVAIGGIDLQSLGRVLATGVLSAALVRAVTQAHNVEETIFALQTKFV